MRLLLTGLPDQSSCYKGRHNHVFAVVESFRLLKSSDQASSPFDLGIMLEAGMEDHDESFFNRDDIIGYPQDADLFT